MSLVINYQRTLGVLLLFLVTLSTALGSGSENGLVRPAPSFSWNQGGKKVSLASLRGRPVLLILAASPKNRALKHQLKSLQESYQSLADQHLLCAIAFSEEEGVIPSNIPFIRVLEGASLAKDYAMNGPFTIALIGADGNLDCLSFHPLSGQRIRDLVDASYMMQKSLRCP